MAMFCVLSFCKRLFKMWFLTSTACCTKNDTARSRRLRARAAVVENAEVVEKVAEISRWLSLTLALCEAKQSQEGLA